MIGWGTMPGILDHMTELRPSSGDSAASRETPSQVNTVPEEPKHSPQVIGNQRSVSVVISTLNRATLLEKTLKSLEQQNYVNFEVVVVNGPSTDHTEDVMHKYDGAIIVGRLDEANLSRSRNIGINLSSGDLVLFLDDDAFAEPDWIANIVEGYSDDTIGGVGTRVYDHTGFKWQMNPFLIDKFYNPNYEARPPLWAFEYANAETIPHILGASSSFSREALIDVGGFDEEIEYFLDESEVCRRVSETGRKIRFLDVGASVHHQFAPGITRDERRLLTHPYPVVKNQFYVCLSDWRRNGGSLTEYLGRCDSRLRDLTDGARWQLDHGGITRKEYDIFMRDVARGKRDGRQRALDQSRKSISVTPARPDDILRFPTMTPPGGRKTICFISRWIPRRSKGGIARYIWDLAVGFAQRGHETHLITMTDGPSKVEFHEGLWIRHIGPELMNMDGIDEHIRAAIGGLQSGSARMNVAWAKAAHAEILRLRRDRYVDLVVAPVWDQEGLYCALDRRLNTVVSMNTTFRRFADIEFRNLDKATVDELSSLENLYVRSTKLFHANSTSSTQHLRQDFRVGEDVRIFQAPHGVSDVSPRRPSAALGGGPTDDTPVRILYVSRLEKRKGSDLFLEAIVTLLRRHPTVQVDIVGRDSYASEPERSMETQFRRLHPTVSGVTFHGEMSDEALVNFYHDADIFCVPSRYESFGIIFIEAMRYKLPVVALDVGGAQDIVENGVTGLLCSDQSSAAVHAALERLVSDPVLRKSMGEKARARFLGLFENEVVVDQTLNGILGLLTSVSPTQAQR